MPIEVLQYGVKVRDPTTQQFSDLAALRGGQGPTGPGVPAGGTDGDVLVKNGATDYAAKWTNTPKLMGSLAYIEQTSTVSKQGGYRPGEYLVWNGQLYKVGNTAIGPSETLTPGGNINVVNIGGELAVISPNQIAFSYEARGNIFMRFNSTLRGLKIPIPLGYRTVTTSITVGSVMSAREMGTLTFDAHDFTVTGTEATIIGPFVDLRISGTGLESYNDLIVTSATFTITLTK